MNRNSVKIFKVQIRGFTVQETIIAMVLTGLISVLTFSAIRYYYRLFSNVVQVGNNQSNINQLQQVLSNDMENAEKVLFETGLVCQINEQNIRYNFMPEKIVRETVLATDTFYIEHEKPTIRYSTNSPDLVSFISFVCKNDDLLIPVCVHKKYPLILQLKEE